MSKSSYHRRKNDDGELGVFEAAGYYSGQNEQGPPGLNRPLSQTWRARRMSSDEHVRRPPPPSVLLQQVLPKQSMSRSGNTGGSQGRHEVRHPRSPGGRLAMFINSLFNQPNSKKKALNNSSSIGCKEPEYPDQRRRRRSSTIGSYSKSSSCTTSNNTKNPISGATTPTKSSYQDRRSTPDIRRAGSNVAIGSGIVGETSGSEPKSSEIKNSDVKSHVGYESRAADCDGDDESDSSSDLFELQIGRGGGYCPSDDLPVYETTRIERIKDIGRAPS